MVFALFDQPYLGSVPPSFVIAPRGAAVDRAYCLGTASGSEGFDRVSAPRELDE
jgi:hypothetical protein